jgi:hypothetical protein
MAKVSESTLVAASLAETWDYYFDPRGWPAWVDQFHAVARRDESYPEAGSRLRWRSVTAGRGEVDERVLEHEPRRRHRIAFSDPESEGELTTTFAIEGESTRVTQELEYRLRGGGPLSLLTDLLFVRSQQRRSLERSLARLRHELEDASG